MAQHVGAKQHFAIAALEAAEVNLVLSQYDSIRAVLLNRVTTDEQLPTADFDHDPSHQRILFSAAQSYDHILDPTHGLAGACQYRRPQQLGEVDDRPLRALPSRVA